MWPTIPSNLTGEGADQLRSFSETDLLGLDAAGLRELAGKMRAARRQLAVDHPMMDAEGHECFESFGGLIDAIEQGAARLEASTEAPPVEDESDDTDPDLSADDDSDDDESDDTDDSDDDDSTEHGTVVTTLGVQTEQQQIEPVRAQWLSTGLGGVPENQPFESMTDIAEAVRQRGKQVQAGSDVKHYIAKLPANFGGRENPDLSDNPYFNLNRFEDPSEITAAMCAPLTPLYDLSCANSTRRPVANGLPNFRLRADRGGFSVYPSPSLTDITTGYGQWTSTDDANLEAIKSECQRITCSTPTEYEIYGIYRCLTVRNLVNMTFPEIVEAYLNRLQAQWARFAETLLLEAMGNGSDTIDSPFGAGFGANTSLKRTILLYLGKYQEIERWDAPVMDAWMPRWLQYALVMDEISRKRNDGGRNTAATMAEIDQAFRDVGVEPHWYMDRPSWATPITELATGGTLNHFPSSVEILIHRRGKFALMDRGELQVGVTGNNIYRLEDDLRRNQFTFFFESFEGLIDTDNCPAHIIQVNNLCYNGAQIADVAIDCEGDDYAGIGS